MRELVIVLLVLLFIGAFGSAPFWGHSSTWGPWPSSGLGLLFIVLLILLLTGRM